MRTAIGKLALTAALGLALASASFIFIGCSSDDAGGSGSGFTLTDIPAKYEGKYVFAQFEGIDGPDLWACQSLDYNTGAVTLGRISNGKVSMPVWDANGQFSGSGTYDGDDVMIYEKSSMDENYLLRARLRTTIVFTNGNATASFNDVN